jgi:hypothetical protein
MYQPLPCITEDLESFQARLRSERDPQLRPRVHLLVLLKSGQVTTRRQAATHLAVHRNTIALWVRTYRAAVFAPLQARLATASGFASYGAIQQWLREEFALEVPSKTLHGLVHYQLKAKLKRPRPSHAKKTQLRQRTLSSSVRAAWGPSLP